ncbi:hypothetical protein F511_31374 [Dorcoceras hygrometricum]|uniref:Uncharacterized protein n=1 Tax=Dorcoceras hygrometricum TaxID=472368 RepID=A0A2Z7DJ29_9LAMI|nr:hypothetical protein F511_31374 [Dorcoceras hygrometricum]
MRHRRTTTSGAALRAAQHRAKHGRATAQQLRQFSSHRASLVRANLAHRPLFVGATSCACSRNCRPSSHGLHAQRVEQQLALNGGQHTRHAQPISVRESRIQYLYDPQWFRDTDSRGPKIIVAPESQFRTCPSDHDSIGYPRMSASGESSTTMHRLLHASGSHPIPPPDDPNIGYPCTKVRGESLTTNHRLLHESGSHGGSIKTSEVITQDFLLFLLQFEEVQHGHRLLLAVGKLVQEDLTEILEACDFSVGKKLNYYWADLTSIFKNTLNLIGSGYWSISAMFSN